MSKSRKRKPARKRIGKVSVYQHHGGWYVYYRDAEKTIRRKVADDQVTAESVAAQINAQLSTGARTLLAFEPISIADLRQAFLDEHEHVRRSSIATVRRYEAATRHIVDFGNQTPGASDAHDINAAGFATYLRQIEVAPNGHENSQRRRLRDKGVLYILQTCRSMYAFASKKRHLPPYSENPFSDLSLSRFHVDDSKAVTVFDEKTATQFLQLCDDWAFPIQFLLATTGVRPGELTHLLIEDVDLNNGWVFIRNKTAVGWRIKTGQERMVPIFEEAVEVLRRGINSRDAGAVFTRLRFGTERPPLTCGLSELETVARGRIDELRLEQSEASRRDEARVFRTVWRDAGAIRTDAIRNAFIRVGRAMDRTDLTCPKSWRHTFATLLQDAEVDPLIRQITLGHKSAGDPRGALGMTGVYTHTRRKTQRRQIERALRLWPEVLKCAALPTDRKS